MGAGVAVEHRARIAGAAMALALMAACGNGTSGLVAGLMGGGAVDLNAVSRGKIEAFGTPILRATVPALGVDVLLSIRETRGDVVTWEAAEGITFTFRAGVLIETRGLGPDLMSASAPSGGQIAAGSGFNRSYYYLWDDDRTQRRSYACTPESRGAEAVTIYGRTHQTRRVAEVCQSAEGRISNDFWFESGAIRQSRQWVSPDAGYATFARVVD